MNKEKRYWYAVNLSKEERKFIRSMIKENASWSGKVVLKSVNNPRDNEKRNNSKNP